MKLDKKVYTWIVVLAPVLGLYYTFLPNITITNLLLILYFIYVVFIKKRFVCDRTSIVLLFLVLINFMTIYFFDDGSQDVGIIGTTFRYVSYIVCLCFITRQCFDWNYGKKQIVNVAIIVSVYLCIQFVLGKMLHIYLPGGLPLLQVTREDMRTHIQYATIYGYRPRSLFGEPAHFCQYVLLAIVILLFDDIEIKRKKGVLFILAISIIFSQSILGITVLAAISIIYVISNLWNTSRKTAINLLIIIPIVLCIIIYTMTHTTIGSEVLSRLSRESLMSDNRIIGITSITDLIGNDFHLWLGAGLRDREIYINSYFSWLYSFGIFGCIVLLSLLLSWFKKANKTGKYILLLLAFLGCGSELFLGIFFFFYLNFVISNAKNKAIEN